MNRRVTTRLRLRGVAVEDDLEVIWGAVKLEDVVRRYVELRPVGRNLVALCPFHDEHTPSFVVRESTGRFHCFGCGAGGEVVGFLMMVEHLDFDEALQVLADKAGIQIDKRTADN